MNYVFTAKLRFPGIFVKMVKILNQFVEYANLQVKNDSLCIETIDAAHVMFVELEFGEAFFDEYSCRGTGAVIGVNVKLLLESVKSIQATDVVWVSTRDETIVIKARRGSSTKFELVVTQVTLLDDGLASMAPHDYPCSVLLSSATWIEVWGDEMCQQVANFGERISIKFEAGELTLKARTEVNRAKITIQTPAEDPNYRIICQEPHKESFKMEFVQKLARVVKLCKVEEVLIELGPNAPMRITLDFEGVCLTFYLAPVLVE